jgi:hypothetical protein
MMKPGLLRRGNGREELRNGAMLLPICETAVCVVIILFEHLEVARRERIREQKRHSSIRYQLDLRSFLGEVDRTPHVQRIF